MIVAIVGGIACVFIAFDLLTRNHTAALSMLMASERLEAKTEREIYQRQEVFGRMIAHEIRTPASSICGALDLLRTLALDSTTAAYVDIIAGGADQILTLVEDMMTSGAADSSGSAGAAGQGNNPADFRLSPIVVDPVGARAFARDSRLGCRRRLCGGCAAIAQPLLRRPAAPAPTAPLRPLPQRRLSSRRGTPPSSRASAGTRAWCSPSPST